MKSAVLALLLLLAPVAAFAQARVEVPIREVVLSDQMRRYVVQIKVGGTTIDAGLDSGSSGIRILPGVLKPGDATETSKSDTYAYGSGAKYDGVIGEAQVSIGATSGKVPVQIIKTVGCVPSMPRCPGNRLPLAKYGIQGNGLPGEGFKAIIGTNMGHAPADSPLPLLGAKRWIIDLPLPGSGRRGRLILNPTEEEAAGFIAFKVDPRFAREPGGMHDAIPACLVNPRTRTGFCGATLLDTGAPGIVVINGKGRVWPNDAPAGFAFGGEQPKTSASFLIGRREFASHLQFTPRPAVGEVRLHAGLMPYFAYSVLYDADAGTVSLKPRSDTAMIVK